MEIIVTSKDEILIFEYQYDYLENELEPLNGTVRLSQQKYHQKSLNRQVLLIDQIIDKDFVQKSLHVEL